MATRIETDSLGAVEVPAESYYGAQTARALTNFPISGFRMPAEMVRAYARIKRAAAEVNGALGVLPQALAEAIASAAKEVEEGGLADQFVVDVFQAGAGTSFHMNVNEVLAARAAERLGRHRGDRAAVSPNDHVNAGQSTNDTFPSAMRLACLDACGPLDGAMRELVAALERRRAAAGDAPKSGRTHLQDAVPMTIAQEIGGWATVAEDTRRRVADAARSLLALPLGGTAIGTGINAARELGPRTVALLAERTGHPLVPAGDRFARIASMADFAHLSAALRGAALELGKIASDLRLLASGPFTGLAEVELPAVQPGSSIMPGKVNPSMPEMLNQVCLQVVGCDAVVSAAAGAGQLQLNVMMPVAAWNLLLAIRILAAGTERFASRCVDGLRFDLARARRYAESTAGLATALNVRLGYLAAAEVAKQAVRDGRPVLEVVRERKLLTEEEIATLLSPDGRGGASG